MNAKYADVIQSDEALDYLRDFRQGMFDLPAGTGGPR